VDANGDGEVCGMLGGGVVAPAVTGGAGICMGRAVWRSHHMPTSPRAEERAREIRFERLLKIRA
jgi:tagatose-1,6-bisphosphate aldolase